MNDLRVLALDLPGDRLFEASRYSSNHGSNGYDCVLLSVAHGNACDEAARAWRAADLERFVGRGGRIVAFGVAAEFSRMNKSWPIESALPIAKPGLDVFAQTEVEAVAGGGEALLNLSDPTDWIPRSLFTEAPAPGAAFDLLVAPRTTDVVGRAIRVGNGWVFLLPALKSNDEEVRHGIVNWALEFSPGRSRTLAPEWLETVEFAGEGALRLAEKDLASKIDQLAKKRQELRHERETLAEWKRLAYATGDDFEEIVTEVFVLLGFEVLPASTGRADHRLSLGDKRVVVEAKGKEKSASERDAAQLEKWVSIELDTDDVQAKGILVVNGWRTQPPGERDEVFPHQMLEYATRRDHCLVTGLELLDVVQSVVQDASTAEQQVQTLISCVGRYADRGPSDGSN